MGKQVTKLNTGFRNFKLSRRGSVVLGIVATIGSLGIFRLIQKRRRGY